MLQILTDQEILSFSYKKLLALIDEQSISNADLHVLYEPGTIEEKLGKMYESEKKLAIFVTELGDRLEKYGDNAVEDLVDDEEEFDTYNELSDLIIKLFDHFLESVTRHLSKRTKLFVHPFPATDGIIYGCRGDCEDCFIHEFEKAEVSNQNAIGEGRAH